MHEVGGQRGEAEGLHCAVHEQAGPRQPSHATPRRAPEGRVPEYALFTSACLWSDQSYQSLRHPLPAACLPQACHSATALAEQRGTGHTFQRRVSTGCLCLAWVQGPQGTRKQPSCTVLGRHPRAPLKDVSCWLTLVAKSERTEEYPSIHPFIHPAIAALLCLAAARVK